MFRPIALASCFLLGAWLGFDQRLCGKSCTEEATFLNGKEDNSGWFVSAYVTCPAADGGKKHRQYSEEKYWHMQQRFVRRQSLHPRVTTAATGEYCRDVHSLLRNLWK